MLKINLYCIRACLKNHSRNLHIPLCGIFRPNSVAVARYGALIRAKSPTNCDAHLAESLFQTRSRACLIIKLYTHICPLDPGLAPEVVSQGQCGLWGGRTPGKSAAGRDTSWNRNQSSWSTSGFAGFLHGDGVGGAAKGDD